MEYQNFYENCYGSEAELTPKQIYQMYRQTDRWQNIRKDRLVIDDYKCRLCGETATDVHHICYPKIFGTEPIAHLSSLCDKCHHNYHFPLSIADVKKDFFQLLEDGKHTTCPVCERFAHYNPRRLNSSTARALIWLVNAYNETQDWINVPITAPKWLTATNQHTTLKYWGLVERAPSSKEKKKHSGLWRPTELGIQFAKCQCSVAEQVLTYDDEKISETDEKITIEEALASYGFDYSEIMRNPSADFEKSKIIRKGQKLISNHS